MGQAQERARALKAELRAATVELESTEQELYKLDQGLAVQERELAAARRRLEEARRMAAEQARAMYRSGGLTMTDAVLSQGPDQFPQRMEFVTVLAGRQWDVIGDARTKSVLYQDAARRVDADRAKARLLRDRAKAAVDRLARRFEEAQRLSARLRAAAAASRRAAAARAATPPAAGSPGAGPVRGGLSCLLEPPYTYLDTWGAPRSGGRSHLGTDVMAPYGAKVLAFTSGVISRESTSSAGGITLYLQGDNAVEYYYAHLSRYAVPAGARVRAGQLIAYNGSSGNAPSSAPHVHFEVHPGGPGSAAVNPYPYVRRACPL